MRFAWERKGVWWSQFATTSKLLFISQLEHEVGWKSFDVALDLLVESFCGNSVECGQVRVEHDAMASNQEDVSFNTLRWNKGA